MIQLATNPTYETSYFLQVKTEKNKKSRRHFDLFLVHYRLRLDSRPFMLFNREKIEKERQDDYCPFKVSLPHSLLSVSLYVLHGNSI
jgi:hypothetical protein